MDNKNPAFLEELDAYLAGQLSPEKAMALEAAIRSDETLAREADLRRAEFEVAENILADDIRRQLAALRQTEPDLPKQTNARTSPGKLWWTAAVAALAGFALFWLIGKKPNSPETPAAAPSQSDSTLIKKQDPEPEAPPGKTMPPVAQKPVKDAKKVSRAVALAQAFYQAPEWATVRGNKTAPADDPLESALALYSKNNFDSAAAILENIGQADPQYWKARFLLGHVYFSLKRFDLASATFQAVSAGRVQPWAEEADWFYLLAALASGEKGERVFSEKMQTLAADSGHPYHDTVLKFREKIGELPSGK